MSWRTAWKSDQAVRIRRIAADAFSDWPRLSVPADMGAVTAADVAGAVADASEGLSASLTAAWVEGAWLAWAAHHSAVEARAKDLVDRLR